MRFVSFFRDPYLTWCTSSVHYTAVNPSLDSKERLLKTGRNAGIATFGLIVSSIVALWSAQICLQVWQPTAKPTIQPANSQSTPLTCSAGTKQLVKAIEDARLLASRQETESAALQFFRNRLSSPWEIRASLEQICQGDTAGLHLLREVDRLRYSEEHAVRYRATDLTKRRHDVARLLSARAQSTESALHPKANP